MGEIWSQIIYALTGLDYFENHPTKENKDKAERETDSSPKVQEPHRSNSVSPDIVLAKPKNPLRSLQIERAWQEFASVCANIESISKFNIEYDLVLDKPVRIALLDTGVFQDHEAFLGRITRVRNFVPRRCQPDANEDLTLDWNGHGTFCAGLAVGGAYSAVSEDGGPEEPHFLNGVAPFAKLVVGKVLDREGRGDVDWLIKGLRWACDIDKGDSRRPVNADIICVPSGFQRYHPELRHIIYHAIQRGKVIVCCAGGEGENATFDVQYPARFGDVICVGSQSDNGQPTPFTPTGREIDFLAPGDNLWSASQRGSTAVRCDSATSYAVAVIAGICALVIAYAEKLGGQDLRRLVSHMMVMKEVLRRMSSTPGHHDKVSGHGNVIPYRLLKYGPQTFFNEICGIVHQTDPSTDLSYLARTLGPLQPILSNFSAGAIMSIIPVDKDAMKGLLRPLIKERVLFKWYELLDKIFVSPIATDRLPAVEVVKSLPSNLKEVDLTVPNGEFVRLTKGINRSGINLTNITETYLFHGSVDANIDKLIMPEFRHVSHFDSKRVFCCISPSKIVIPGKTPLAYLLDIVEGLFNTKKTNVTVICEKLALFERSKHQPHDIKVLLDNIFDKVKDEPSPIYVYISQVDIQTVNNIDMEILNKLIVLSSHNLAVTIPSSDKHVKSSRHSVFFTQEEEPKDDTHDDQPESSELKQGPNTDPTSHFAMWPEIKSYLCDNRKNIALDEFAHNAKPIREVLLKGYDDAMHILSSSCLADDVSSLDLRLSHVSLNVPADMQIQQLMPRSDLCIAPSEVTVKDFALIEEDLRTLELSGILRSLNVKLPPDCQIKEAILPHIDRICDVEQTFSCPLWRKCQNLYVPGETKFTELLQIMRILPKGDYSLNIHVEKLRLENSLAGEKSRDFDVPDKLSVHAYDVILDPLFFQMSEQTIKGFYEMCLKLSSPTCLDFLKKQCDLFLQSEKESVVPYNCQESFSACTMLQGFLDEAITEELVSEENAVIQFCPDLFKFSIMTAGIGRERYRLAFKPIEVTPLHNLPVNAYRKELVDINKVYSSIRSGKLKNVTVAILGSGINAFHPEFDLKMNQIRSMGRDKNCPFGESIIGLAFNAIPAETMHTFMDHQCQIGTVCAALVAGKSKGAAPFANIVSLKVTNSSFHSKPEYVNCGLSWLLEQEEKSYLPPADVIFIPLNFHEMSFELHRLVNRICAAGKIVICSTANFDGSCFPGSGATPIGYPAQFGDVICIGPHNSNGEVMRGGGQGRVIDLLALGELSGQDSNNPSLKPFLCPMPKVPAILAAAQVAGIVAYALAYAEYTGGPSLRQAVSNNSVMREILRHMCTKPGQHDERSGYGCFNPHQVFKYGADYFKKIVSEITEEYYEISTSSMKSDRKVYNTPTARNLAKRHISLDAVRSRSSSFTENQPQGPARKQRSRTQSESVH